MSTSGETLCHSATCVFCFVYLRRDVFLPFFFSFGVVHHLPSATVDISAEDGACLLVFLSLLAFRRPKLLQLLSDECGVRLLTCSNWPLLTEETKFVLFSVLVKLQKQPQRQLTTTTTTINLMMVMMMTTT